MKEFIKEFMEQSAVELSGMAVVLCPGQGDLLSIFFSDGILIVVVLACVLAGMAEHMMLSDPFSGTIGFQVPGSGSFTFALFQLGGSQVNVLVSHRIAWIQVCCCQISVWVAYIYPETLVFRLPFWQDENPAIFGKHVCLFSLGELLLAIHLPLTLIQAMQFNCQQMAYP